MTQASSSIKTKIMFCIDFIYFSTEGTENQLIKLINNINHDRFDVYLLCLKNTDWLEENKSKLKCSVTAFTYNEMKHPDPGNIAVFFRIVRHIKQIAPDIFLAFFKISYVVGVLAARLAGVRTIISTRRDYGVWLDPKGIHLLRFANRFVHSIITNSFKVRELTSHREKFDISKIDVIYNGLETREFNVSPDSSLALKVSLGIPASHKVVGIVAGLRDMKRHNIFIAAAKIILDSRSDLSFVIIGDGPLRQSLEATAESLGILNNMYFLGWQTDIPLYVSFFDIGVNCSSMEGLSNAIMEYMAAGIPCVVSDAGGNPELIENGANGYTFKLDDADELAGRILSLLDSPSLGQKFISGSKAIIGSKMTIESMIRSYENYFDAITAECQK